MSATTKPNPCGETSSAFCKPSPSTLYFLGLWVLFLFTGCPASTTSQHVQTDGQKSQPKAYEKSIITEKERIRHEQLLRAFQVDVGDVIDIKVYGEPDLSGTFQIYPDCKIQFPLIKTVSVCGRTPGEIRTNIASRLHQQYFQTRPSVSVQVKQYNSKKIHVLGQVNRAGRFDYNPGLTLVEAIAMAGGFTNQAAPADTRLLRTIGGVPKVFRVNLSALGNKELPDITLNPGDVVVVPKSWL